MYEIEFSVKAAKAYLKLPSSMQEKIDYMLANISKNPYAKQNNIKRLTGMSHCYRLRVRNYRVVYEIVNHKMKIYVIKMGLRKEVYRQ